MRQDEDTPGAQIGPTKITAKPAAWGAHSVTGESAGRAEGRDRR
jgi:hypothetical protein